MTEHRSGLFESASSLNSPRTSPHHIAADVTAESMVELISVVPERSKRELYAVAPMPVAGANPDTSMKRE